VMGSTGPPTADSSKSYSPRSIVSGCRRRCASTRCASLTASRSTSTSRGPTCASRSNQVTPGGTAVTFDNGSIRTAIEAAANSGGSSFDSTRRCCATSMKPPARSVVSTFGVRPTSEMCWIRPDERSNANKFRPGTTQTPICVGIGPVGGQIPTFFGVGRRRAGRDRVVGAWGNAAAGAVALLAAVLTWRGAGSTGSPAGAGTRS